MYQLTDEVRKVSTKLKTEYDFS